MSNNPRARLGALPGWATDAFFVSFDIETTGLIAGVDRVVELGAVAFSLSGVRGVFESLVDPGIPIPEGAQRVNHITDEMVKGSPSIQDALPRLFSFIGDAFPVAHNAIFDTGFLCADIERFSLDAPDAPILDTRALAQAAFPGRRSYSLDALVLELGLRAEEKPGAQPIAQPVAHRALADAYRCRALFLACLDTLSEGRPLTLAALAGKGGGPLSFRTHAPSRSRVAAILQRAIALGSSAEIDYTSGRGERTTRRIRPISFSMVGGSPAVIAFCYLRKENRTFLLDAISEIRETP